MCDHTNKPSRLHRNETPLKSRGIMADSPVQTELIIKRHFHIFSLLLQFTSRSRNAHSAEFELYHSKAFTAMDCLTDPVPRVQFHSSLETNRDDHQLLGIRELYTSVKCQETVMSSCGESRAQVRKRPSFFKAPNAKDTISSGLDTAILLNAIFVRGTAQTGEVDRRLIYRKSSIRSPPLESHNFE